MKGFSIDPDDAQRAAGDAYELGNRLAMSPAAKYGLNPGESGDGELAAAIRRAQEASTDAISLLSTTAISAAHRLTDTIKLYAGSDQKSAELFEKLANEWRDG